MPWKDNYNKAVRRWIYSGHLMGGMVTSVNNTVLYTEELLRGPLLERQVGIGGQEQLNNFPKFIHQIKSRTELGTLPLTLIVPSSWSQHVPSWVSKMATRYYFPTYSHSTHSGQKFVKLSHLKYQVLKSKNRLTNKQTKKKILLSFKNIHQEVYLGENCTSENLVRLLLLLL